MSGLHIHQKRNFHVVRWTLALILVVGLSLYAYFGVRWYSTGELSPFPMPVAAADTSIDESTVTQQQIDAHKAGPEEPRYISFPTLSIENARITHVGLDSRNMLNVPGHIDSAGWYPKSAHPGSGVGAVLLNGHNEGYSRKGLFSSLTALKPGDQTVIERGDGTQYTYEVSDVRTMPLQWVNSVGMKEMMRSVLPEKEGLSLIAGAGKWIPRDGTYDQRVLVRATLVE